MSITRLADYPAHAGGKEIIVANVTGPASYVAATGQPVGSVNAQTGISVLGLGSIDFINGSASISGTYSVVGQPTGTGSRKVWNLIWIVNSTGVPVANGVNLSAETVSIEIIGR